MGSPWRTLGNGLDGHEKNLFVRQGSMRHRMGMRFWLVLALLLAGSLVVVAQSSLRQESEQDSAAGQRTKWDEMDIGPFQAYGLEALVKGRLWRPALKGLNIRLGNKAAVCFDTERMRMAAGWTGGFIKMPVKRDGLEGVPRVVGEFAFRTMMGPGWASAAGGWSATNAPVRDGNNTYSPGPLPRAWAKWRGHYTCGDRVVMNYTVGEADILELPEYHEKTGTFLRRLDLRKTGGLGRMEMLVCEVPEGKAWPSGKQSQWQALEKNGQCTVVWNLVPAEESGVSLPTPRNGRITMRIDTDLPRLLCGVAVWRGPRAKVAGIVKRLRDELAAPKEFDHLAKGGPSQWGKNVLTRGRLGLMPGPYVVDTITVPEENPWNSWIRCSGFDFFKDGTTAAMCSVSGDVWVVSGIDDELKELKWRRFATGMFQPLGLKVLNEKVFVLGRDQITKLHDLNGDGEADFYENFNNDISISNHYHEFCLNLEVDAKGNFYFTKGSNLGKATVPHHGCLVKVSADGEQLEVVASGHRAPNGLSVGPGGEITSADNEGNWVPTSRINWVKRGGFYGHVPTAHRLPVPTDYDKPLLWLPHQIDNSSGNQVWVSSGKWGPFKGNLLHLSYGRCALFQILREEVDGQAQGAAVRFPLRFESGIMRGRFNPRDGQLYLAGLRVWQSSGARYGAFHRVRYTGKPVHMPIALQVKKNGLEISFTNPLDAASAVDDQNYAVDQWNYQWSAAYGSRLYSVKDPAKVLGEKKTQEVRGDPVEIKSIKLSDDKKTVFLETDLLKPVMQSRIQYNLTAADGSKLRQEIFHTINRVPTQ